MNYKRSLKQQRIENLIRGRMSVMFRNISSENKKLFFMHSRINYGVETGTLPFIIKSLFYFFMLI